jgi:hypothetical protein
MKRSDLRKLVQSELAPLVAGVELDVEEDEDGVVHLCSSGLKPWCAKALGSYGGPSWRRRSAGASEVATGCEACVRNDSNEGHKGSLAVLADLVGARASLVSMAVVEEGTSAATLARRRKAAERVVSTYEPVPAGLPVAARAAASDLVEAARDVLEVLAVASTSDAVREKALEVVRTKVSPARWAGTFELDDTAMVIGVCPVPEWATNELKAVFDALGVRREKSLVVLEAPAYVVTFLVGRLRSRPDDLVMVQSCPAPEDKDLLETAAMLWDPFGEGALVGLKECLRAAQALAG